MRVLAKAYGDRPLDRVAVGENARVIYIANMEAANSSGIDSPEGVGFPRNCVFEFDSALFESLIEAWDRQEREQLERLWKRAVPVQEGVTAQPQA